MLNFLKGVKMYGRSNLMPNYGQGMNPLMMQLLQQQSMGPNTPGVLSQMPYMQRGPMTAGLMDDVTQGIRSFVGRGKQIDQAVEVPAAQSASESNKAYYFDYQGAKYHRDENNQLYKFNPANGEWMPKAGLWED